MRNKIFFNIQNFAWLKAKTQENTYLTAPRETEANKTEERKQLLQFLSSSATSFQ